MDYCSIERETKDISPLSFLTRLIEIVDLFWEDKSQMGSYSKKMMELDSMKKTFFSLKLLPGKDDLDSKFQFAKYITILVKTDVLVFSRILSLPRKPPERVEKFSKLKEEAIHLYKELLENANTTFEAFDTDLQIKLKKTIQLPFEQGYLLMGVSSKKKGNAKTTPTKKKQKIEKDH